MPEPLVRWGTYDRTDEGGPFPRKPQKPVWVPLHEVSHEGRKVTLAGTSRFRISEKIVVRRTLDVKNLQTQPIGNLYSITNDGGALTVVFMLNEGAVNPGGKFLLGLIRRGLHISIALSAVPLRPEDESPHAYVGMLGEEF